MFAAKDLHKEYVKAKELREANGLQDYEIICVEELTDQVRGLIDFICTLGGDGTILWASKQFSGNSIPPMLTFNQGSLGFLCNFVFEDHHEILDKLVEHLASGGQNQNSDLGLDKRIRLKVTMGEGCEKTREVFRGDNLQNSSPLSLESFHVLNEVVVDRGPSPYSTTLELYINENKFTSIVGDGIIISTPTGSTAYSLSAGGSIVQANTEIMLITPLAPHSLSFRPLILPASSVVRLKKPEDNRGNAWVSLDGATRFILKDGESLVVTASRNPMMMVNLKSDNLTDLWAQRLTKLFGWNVRETNKPLEKHKFGKSSSVESSTLTNLI